jgi:FkbM family methyltransferase
MIPTRFFYAVYRLMFRRALKGLGFNNWRSLKESGEAWMVRQILPKLSMGTPTFLDVGANSGDYSTLLVGSFPQAIIHAFEPHPRTYETLKKNMRPNVRCHPVALGRESGMFNLYDRGGNDGGIRASLAKEALETVQSKPLTAYPVTVSTVDEFLREQNIQRVDFMKIDTEGFEMDVLQGAKASLGEGKIGAIQFEFNDVHFARRQFLADFQAVLPSHRLYRILRDGLVPLDLLSVAEREVFTFQNILAWPLTATPL